MNGSAVEECHFVESQDQSLELSQQPLTDGRKHVCKSDTRVSGFVSLKGLELSVINSSLQTHG